MVDHFITILLVGAAILAVWSIASTWRGYVNQWKGLDDEER
jgi:hypothetical protein